MKILRTQSAPGGSTLLIVIMFVGILTLAMGSYLAMTSNENQSVLRSRCWNAALPLAEAGIEEAFSQIHNNPGNYTADGWQPAGGAFTKQRYFGDDYYTVTISGTPTTGLTVSSTGFVHSVSISDHGTYNSLDASYVPRSVQVIAQLSEIPIPTGLMAKSSVQFTGTLGVDSYDTSSLASSSTNTVAIGMYDPTKRSAQALVGCDSSAAMNLSGNAHIHGYAASGVGALLPSVTGSASVGDLSWVKGPEDGHITNNFNVALPDVVAPYSSANPPAIVTTNIHGQIYDYRLNGGNYMISTIGGKSLYVGASSTLYVTGDATANKIAFAPGAKLDLYVGGTMVPCPDLYNELTNADGSFAALSQAVAPAEFKVLGLNSCNTLNMNSSKFVGILYAPHVNLNSKGNASIFGSVAVDTFACNGTFDFHYDLSLTNTVSTTALKIQSWAER